MHKEEKPKRKQSTYRKILLSLGIGIVACGAMFCVLDYAIKYIGVPHSEVALLDGIANSEAVEALLLEHLPIGTSRAVVETFIAEQLQASETCRQTLPDGLCQTVKGTWIACNYWQWDISFYFDDERLSQINVQTSGSCV